MFKRNRTSIAALALLGAVLVFSMDCGRKYESEKEPNESFYSAAPVRMDGGMQGFLSTPEDKDIFMLPVKSAAVIDIELTAIKGVNHAFQIWKQDAGLVLLKQVDDARKSSPERFCNLYCEPGTYYIVVMHGNRDAPAGNTENPYVLTCRERRAGDEEREPNDSLSEATEIKTGTDIKGYFSPAFNRLNEKGEVPMREEDWFEFTMDLGDSSAKVVSISLSGVSGVNSVLSLFNSRRVLIAQADSKGAGEGETLRDIGITSGGKYFVMAASRSFESNHETPYRLGVKTGEHDESSELEPNNDIPRATVMAEKSMEGKIFPDGDVDFYRHQEGKGRAFYAIEAVPPDSLDIIMTIIGRNRQKIFEVDNGGAGEREVFPNALLDPEFYVMVSAKRGQYDKNSPYTLSMAPFAFSDNYEVEPNDGKENANRVRKKILKGYISKKHDIDCFLLEYPRRAKATFDIEGIDDAELRISITDPAGYEIRTEELTGDKRISITEMIDGRGYLIIEAMRESYDRPYQVKIRED